MEKAAVCHLKQAQVDQIKNLTSVEWDGVKGFSGSCISVRRDFVSVVEVSLCPFYCLLKDSARRQGHQSSHLFLGFIGASALQPKCFENSRELEMVPMTLNLDGL